MTDQSAPNPVRRAAEAVTTTAANGWTFATEAIKTPLVQTIGSLLVAAILGAGTLAGYQKVTAPLTLPVALPDLPKSLPTPVVSMENLDHALELRCGKLEGKVDELKKMLEPKGSMKKTSGKK